MLSELVVLLYNSLDQAKSNVLILFRKHRVPSR